MSFGPLRRRLIPHPDFPCPAVRSIEVEVRQEPGRLCVDYVLRGEIDALRLPLTLPEAHRDDPLWEHSCFEAFFALPAGQRDDGIYNEFNFAPWGGWAAYGFTGYRSGQGLLTGLDPRINAQAGSDEFRLGALLADPGRVRVGLSAVIEDVSGKKSYWALAHTNPEKPDFHHPDCFALELPAPDGA